ncbi:hypothetical protein [Pseudomonas coronafaciens]|uniref:hypothetical protein n=1 Tax=Pseudomonas coronafaciens TaxID=53409 RepID=UPI001424AAE1|nr:hypothetical protein [Pseudomonas coronafaciens]QIQ73244.1 hypothetical protein HBB04_03646 [Pseudomonas coronafaciens]
MSNGIRIRGSQGQVQIDDSAPCYVVLEEGTFSAANLQALAANNPDPYLYNTDAFYNRHVINFAKVVTTQEAPLVFLKLQSVTFMSCFQVEGQPGAWTGFSIGLGGLQVDSQVTYGAKSGQWFSAAKTPCPSGATVGVRIRNRQTNQIVYDSGWRLVKFLQQTANFQPEGRISHNVLIYTVGYPEPATAYFLANSMTGLLSFTNRLQQMSICITAEFPNKLLMVTYTADDNAIAYQSYSWTALFGVPGN